MRTARLSTIRASVATRCQCLCGGRVRSSSEQVWKRLQWMPLGVTSRGWGGVPCLMSGGWAWGWRTPSMSYSWGWGWRCPMSHVLGKLTEFRQLNEIITIQFSNKDSNHIIALHYLLVSWQIRQARTEKTNNTILVLRQPVFCGIQSDLLRKANFLPKKFPHLDISFY